MAITAEEKIKQLLEEEKIKRAQIDKKRKEVEDQRRALEELEAKAKREISKVHEEIDEQIEEIAEEQKRAFVESEKRTLEERAGEAPRAEQAPRGYAEAIEQITRGNTDFYSITNYNVVTRLDNIASEASRRPLTEAERSFVRIVEYHAERLGKDGFYADKQGANYLKQELAKIDFINELARKGQYDR